MTKIKYFIPLLAASVIMSLSEDVCALELPFVPADPAGQQQQQQPQQPQPTDYIYTGPEVVDQTPAPIPDPTPGSVPVISFTPYPATDNTANVPPADTIYYTPDQQPVPGTMSVSVYPTTGDTYNVSGTVISGELNVKAATDSLGNITLSWNKIPGAGGYVVYNYDKGSYERLKMTSSGTYTLKKAKNGKTYTFVVRCIVNGNELTYPAGTVSVKVYYKPLVSAAAKDGKVSLKWKAVPDAKEYAVYRMNGSKLKKVNTTAKTAVKIRQKPGDTGYAVKAYIDGRWTTVTKADIARVEDQ